MSVELYFRGEKMAKVMGSLAMQKPQEGVRVGYILNQGCLSFRIMGGGNDF